MQDADDMNDMNDRQNIRNMEEIQDNGKEKPQQNRSKSQINPSAMQVEQLLAVYSKLGYSITKEMIQHDIENGAPTNPDGTLHLVNLCAWQVQQYVNKQQNSRTRE